MSGLNDLITDLADSQKKLYDKTCVESWYHIVSTKGIFNTLGLNSQLNSTFEPSVTPQVDYPEELVEDFETYTENVKALLKNQWSAFIAELQGIYETNKAVKKEATEESEEEYETPKEYFDKNPTAIVSADGIRNVFGSGAYKLSDITALHQEHLSKRLAILTASSSTKSERVTVSVEHFVKGFELNDKFEPKIKEKVSNKLEYEKELKLQWDSFIKELDTLYRKKKLPDELPSDFFKSKSFTQLFNLPNFAEKAVTNLWSSSKHDLSNILESHQEMLNERLKIIVSAFGEEIDIELPTSLLADRDNDTADDRHITKVKSIPDLLIWFIKQFDSVIGEFPIEIEIEDTDPLQEGNQAKRVTLPNLAEAVAETYGLAVKSAINSEVQLNFMLRLATEVIATKNSSLITQDYARGNASFLGYKANPAKRDITYALSLANPDELTNLEDILKTSTASIIGWQEDDPESVVSYLQKCVFAAGIIKASMFRGKSNIKQLKKETKTIQKDTEKLEDSWKEFKKEIENPNSVFNKDSNFKPDIDDLTNITPKK